jgi:hypothetical protein
MRNKLAVLAVSVMATMAIAGPALAAGGSGEDPPATKPKVERKVDPKVASERNVLPFTGADITLFATAGFAAVGTGGVLVRRARVRSARA